jgi:hypothetical protein
MHTFGLTQRWHIVGFMAILLMISQADSNAIYESMQQLVCWRLNNTFLRIKFCWFSNNLSILSAQQNQDGGLKENSFIASSLAFLKYYLRSFLSYLQRHDSERFLDWVISITPFIVQILFIHTLRKLYLTLQNAIQFELNIVLTVIDYLLYWLSILNIVLASY